MEQEQKRENIETGDVSEEAMDAIGEGVNSIQKGEGGQDHSTDDIEDREPTEGVGAIQDNSLIRDDIADIDE